MSTENELHTSTAEKLDRYLTRIAPFGFSGALLVARRGRVLLDRGYGDADRSARVPNTADTVFSLGSVTKQFTAAAVMKLTMLGELRPQDPIARHLERVPSDKAGITLHHLLTHTSGLIDYTGDDFEMASREEALARMLGAPLRFAPGVQFAYSNAGYSLLAAIVELASGRTYEAFVREQLFEPAGMFDTGYRLPDWSGKTVAHWYVDELDHGTPLTKPFPSWNLLGNGDMLATTADMYRWHVALQGEDLLSREAKAELYRPSLAGYGYGWSVAQTEHGLLAEHGGASSYGPSAHFGRYVDEDAVFMLFCNEMNGGAFPTTVVREAVRELLFGGEVALPPEVEADGAGAEATRAGEYGLREGGRVRVHEVHHRLHVHPLDAAATATLFGVTRSQQHELEMLTTELLVAAKQGDRPSVERLLARKDERLDRFERFMAGFLQEVPLERLDIVGPIPSAFVPGALDMFITTPGAEGDPLLFVWGGGQNVGYARVGGDPRARSMMPCIRQNGGELLGWHLGSGRSVRVHLAP